MSKVDSWLLPDGIDEVLPEQARLIEGSRRELLDLYNGWGYDLVIPPMVEFTESLLSGFGSDLDLMTFRLTDQLSGRMMGIRADITPQAARIDAHSLNRQGPNRLCYAGTVLQTKPRGPLESRTPISVGVELFGEAGVSADIEVIELFLKTLDVAGVDAVHLDLGHVDILRGLLWVLIFQQIKKQSYLNCFSAKQAQSLKHGLTVILAIQNWLIGLNHCRR